MTRIIWPRHPVVRRSQDVQECRCTGGSTFPKDDEGAALVSATTIALQIPIRAESHRFNPADEGRSSPLCVGVASTQLGGDFVQWPTTQPLGGRACLGHRILGPNPSPQSPSSGRTGPIERRAVWSAEGFVCMTGCAPPCASGSSFTPNDFVSNGGIYSLVEH